MPCRYRIDSALQLTVIEVEGQITGEALLHVQAALLRDPAFDPQMRQLCDFRAARLTMVGSPDIKQLAERSATRGKRAIVVEHGFPFGLARMFEAYANMNRQPTEVFADMDEAMAWLRTEEGE